MTHLSPEEFVDAVDGVLDPARQAHVDACPTCRREVTALAALMREASRAEVPEPSPLFWTHLSARVQRAIADEPPAAGLGWWRWPVLAPMGALAALLVVLVGSLPRTDPGAPAAAVVTAATAQPTSADAPPPADIALADAGPWDVVAELVGTLDWETAGEAGLALVPGDSEHAAMMLTEEESAELSRLLRGELARPKS